MTKRWYIVHAYSNFENKVAQSIKDQRHSAASRTSSTRSWCRPRRSSRCAAAARSTPSASSSRYVLVKCDLTDEVYHLIKNTPKVTGFLGADKSKPVPIPDREAERIKGQVAEGVDHPKPSVSLRSASRSASPTGPSHRSTASSRKSTTPGPASRWRCPSSAAPRRSNSNTLRSRRSDRLGKWHLYGDTSQVPDRGAFIRGRSARSPAGSFRPHRDLQLPCRSVGAGRVVHWEQSYGKENLGLR